ncbi:MULTISPECIES: MarR family winged helix-turn-helix transcriptional regulator [Streptosporangium]|uniref:DNA-binding MarR family transcriptional regulator n=1 Tax=Streptosporangium brasiliense TaxID=47480 RepID=A0ABT9R1J6_9ACTN|nr:MarR family winged helix-turn-helix transcriptional regulator [Streptosporangium brasiliense]MDP9863097.1 DNA-binding MarR family transcriptional regulator [Streptosporangium brasiliense]
MTTSAPSRTVPDLSMLLTHTGHVLATQMTAALAELGITPRGYCVLFHAMEAERTQIQLAEISDLDKTTMVVTVDELEKAGLAERRPSSTDRRARIISVTEEGRRIVAEGTAISDRVHADVLAALPADERAPFVGALERLLNGHLATPMVSERPVRRARQSRA